MSPSETPINSDAMYPTISMQGFKMQMWNIDTAYSVMQVTTNNG
jgi:hypothetical protein